VRPAVRDAFRLWVSPQLSQGSSAW
jgi:hypothetical protein